MIHAVATGIVCAVRQHGENGAIVRALTEDHGLLAGYVQGARGRSLRPVLIAGNSIKGEWRGRVETQLPSLSVEPLASRAHLLSEPLAIAGIDWATALTAATLPEAHPYPALYSALDGLLSAIEYAPSARGWAGAMGQYEELLLAQLGYGEVTGTAFDMARNRKRLVANLLGEHRRDVMATRERLVERLKQVGQTAG
jgi:DNA repair protein RecO (recombination protein O)